MIIKDLVGDTPVQHRGMVLMEMSPSWEEEISDPDDASLFTSVALRAANRLWEIILSKAVACEACVQKPLTTVYFKHRPKVASFLPGGPETPATVEVSTSVVIVVEELEKPTYERLKDKAEWSTPQPTFKDEIVGAFAKWAIRQSPIGIPVGLENVCGYLDACLSKDIAWENGMAELSLCDINKLLHDTLMDKNVKFFDDWNRSQAEKDGNVDCPRNTDMDPYHDFIDLDALLHNVCIDIRDDRRSLALI